MSSTTPGRTGDSGREPAGVPVSESTAPPHTTAFRLGRRYSEDWPVSSTASKRSDREDDGYVTSRAYLKRAGRLRESGGKGARWAADQAQRAGGSEGGGDDGECRFSLDYHHWLEDYLGRRWARRLLGWLSRPRRGRKTRIEEAIESYGDTSAPWRARAVNWPIHAIIRRIAGDTPVDVFRRRVAEHTSTVRGLVLTARSVAEFGLSTPQRFSAPMFVVWNFTNQCNLRCKHCYQDTDARRLPDELTLEEKLAVVDQAGELYTPMIAFAGGEPTLSRDLLPVLRRCQHWGIHTSVATHGGTLTRELAGQLAAAGVRYVEVSLDSVHAAKHDRFRGVAGMWERTVRGMRIVASTPGLRLGVAMCVHRGNFAEVEEMIRFALDVGATTFAHFNFIPVGRGLEMFEDDLTPRQREELLHRLNRWMQSGRIGVISTAPQLGKLCLAYAPWDGRTAASHAGSGAGWKARVIAKYLGGCGAGRCYVAIEPNGDVTPCVYLPHRVLGNLRQRPLGKIARDNPLWEICCDRDRRLGHCEVCEFKRFCGGCLARADAYYGVLNAGDPGCLFNEKHWEELVRRAGAAQAEHAAPATTTVTASERTVPTRLAPSAAPAFD